MKKSGLARKIIVVLTAVFMSFAALGCGNDLPYYDSMSYSVGKEKADYNNNLFYRNDNKTPIADVAAVYIDDPASSEYGYYYLYGTTSTTSIQCYRSKTLEDWEPMETVFELDGNSEAAEAVYNCYWAPEVILTATKAGIICFFGVGEKQAEVSRPLLRRVRQPLRTFYACT